MALHHTHRRALALPGWRVGALLSYWAALRRSRQALARLDDDQLADVGLTRGDACAEARRPVWDAPATWRRS